MKKLFLIALLISAMTTNRCLGQYTGSFTVQGNIAYFYPVVIQDMGWSGNKATEFELGRSSVHTDATWRGSIISKFRVHTNDWGNGSNFIDADIRQFNSSQGITYFVAGWADATNGNANSNIIVWLKGGGTTYYFNSSANITPTVYDGVVHALPYAEPNGPSRTYKTTVDTYVNSNGTSVAGSIYATGSATNYFAGNVGIGTLNPDQKLTVNGQVHATSVVVTSTVPADYVFDSDYYLRPLTDVKTYVDKNHHLPDVPAAADFKKDGQNLGEMNMLLLRKVEELTLYLIEKDKREKEQADVIKQQNERLKKLEETVKTLSGKTN